MKRKYLGWVEIQKGNAGCCGEGGYREEGLGELEGEEGRGGDGCGAKFWGAVEACWVVEEGDDAAEGDYGFVKEGG